MRNTVREIAPLVLISRAAIMAGFRMPFASYEPGKAGWKLTADGKGVEMKDGNPIWIDANGSEGVLNGDAITRLNGEAATLRKRAEKAEEIAATFKDIDPEKARKAIETIGKIDAKKLIDSGEVDKVKEQIKGEFTAQMEELKTANVGLKTQLDNKTIDAVFASSDFIRDRIAIPRDMVEASLRSNFKIDEKDGKVYAVDKAGNRLMSKKNTGDYAAPDEALELLIEAHPQKDTILKANANSGSGNTGNGGNRGQGAVHKRKDWEKLDPASQASVMDKVRKGEAQLID